MQAKDMINNCTECFKIERNRTLDRHMFLSRKQGEHETLQQYWNALNGLAAKCEFGEQTKTLVHDIFILNMHNKRVQEKLCTEPFENPDDALQFAISYEEGVKRQKSYGLKMAESQKVTVKAEPVYAVESGNTRKCYRCGAGNFTMDHVKKCPAERVKCNYCQNTGHFAKCCSRNPASTERVPVRKQMRRVNYLEEDSEEEGTLVLKVDGEGAEPFMMNGLMNNKTFSAIIDSGSPVSIFGVDELKKILEVETMVVKPMPEDEKYMDFGKKPINLLGFRFLTLEVGGILVQKARVLVTHLSV